MPPYGALGPAWHEILDKHQAALASDLAQLLSADRSEAVSTALADERAQSTHQIARACKEARRIQSESLNQSLRRLRLAVSEQKTLQLLNETCAQWAQRSVVLVFAPDEGTGTRAASVAATGLAGGREVDFPLSDAPAIAAALESRDPLVTIASRNQISPTLAASFSAGDDDDEDRGYEKAYLFPLVACQSSVAMLIASGTVDPTPVELLCEAAAMRLEAFTQTAAPSPAGHGSQNFVSHDLTWDDLTPEDQSLHLQAQRMARVRVAEMRLYEEDAVRRGQAAGNLYQTLQNRIDAARREFLQTFLPKSQSMVDYLHLEILRSLGGGDPKLLGTGYPGPLV